MNLTRFTCLFCIAIAAMFMACSPAHYPANSMNVALLEGKGEVVGTVEAIAAPETKKVVGVNTELAYAVTDEWMAIGSLYFMKESQGELRENWLGQGNYIELGGGRYGNMGRNLFKWEALAGIGSGHTRTVYEEINTEIVTTRYFKPFFQGTVGLTTKYLDVALTPRFSYISYEQSAVSNLNAPVIFPDRKGNQFVFEPGITVRGGLERLKFQMQYVHSNFEMPIGVNALNGRGTFSFGLNLVFPKRPEYYY